MTRDSLLITWNPSMGGQSVGNSHLGADILSVSRVVVEVALHVTLPRHAGHGCSGQATTFSAPPFCLCLLEYISLSSLTTVTPLEVLTRKKCNFPLSKKYTYVSYLDIYTIWTQIANRSVAHRKGIYRICKHQKLNR